MTRTKEIKKKIYNSSECLFDHKDLESNIYIYFIHHRKIKSVKYKIHKYISFMDLQRCRWKIPLWNNKEDVLIARMLLKKWKQIDYKMIKTIIIMICRLQSMVSRINTSNLWSNNESTMIIKKNRGVFFNET